MADGSAQLLTALLFVARAASLPRRATLEVPSPTFSGSNNIFHADNLFAFNTVLPGLTRDAFETSWRHLPAASGCHDGAHDLAACPELLEQLGLDSGAIYDLIETMDPQTTAKHVRVANASSPASCEVAVGRKGNYAREAVLHDARLTPGSKPVTGAECVEHVRKTGSTIVVNFLEIIAAKPQGQLSRFEDRLLPLHLLNQRWRKDLGLAVSINAYVTPASKQGFKYHYDNTDVVILQLEGEKTWDLCGRALIFPKDPPHKRAHTWAQHQGETVVKQFEDVKDLGTSPPEQRVRRAMDDGCHRLNLRRGDSLYMPPGVMHRARAVGGIPSLHLTLSIYSPGFGWAGVIGEALAQSRQAADTAYFAAATVARTPLAARGTTFKMWCDYVATEETALADATRISRPRLGRAGYRHVECAERRGTRQDVGGPTESH